MQPAARPEQAEPESFESLVAQLTALVERLEREEMPLEEALSTFERGVRLVQAGNARLEAAERRVEQLVTEGDRVRTQPLLMDEELAAR
ncbi:MAG: exodeoxyribonuclease VII small subunit [Myxococcota bacterium]|nr:exodeoxyribonuclease VII small subunit [Myxococcota bacterium]MDW8362638.1 exodeoxyribonuclease VII small subunit [Myxococcales bacterium]